MAGEAGA
jgi:hypothetical protein